jgi:hypothetical protein
MTPYSNLAAADAYFVANGQIQLQLCAMQHMQRTLIYQNACSEEQLAADAGVWQQQQQRELAVGDALYMCALVSSFCAVSWTCT